MQEIMYRFLKNASSTASCVGFPRLRIPQTLNYCTLCNDGNVFLSGTVLPYNVTFRRNLSTEQLMRIQNSMKKGKKYKKFKKKFIELLEVKEDRSNVTKAAVRNLTPKDVSQLTQKPEISLENLHLSVKKGGAPLSRRVTATPAVKQDDLLNHANLLPLNDEDWENKSEAEIELDLIGRNTENIDMFSDALPEPFAMPTPSTVAPKKSQKGRKKAAATTAGSEKKVSAKLMERYQEEERLRNIELQNKNKLFQEQLNSYIEACVYCDFLTLAYNTLHRYLNKFKFLNVNHVNLEAFNKLIHGFAQKGNIDKVLDVIRMAISCKVDFDYQTFVGCFECLSGLPESPANMEKREIVLKQFAAHGFTFQDLFTKGVFIRNQREKVLNFVNTIDPNFVPRYELPEQNYLCPLLQVLNNDTRSQWQSPAETIITPDELTRFSNEQMRIELQPFEKIDSVIKPTNINGEIRFFRRKWSKLENKWRDVIREAFDNNLKNLELQLNNTKLFHSVNIYPYFKLLDPEEYVDIIVTEINKLLRGSETYSPSLKLLHIDVGKQVKLRYDIKRLKDNQITDKINNIYAEYCKWYLNPQNNPSAQNSRAQWQKLLHENAGIGPSIDDCSSPWNSELLRNIGKFLYNILINELKVDVNILSSDSKAPLCTVSAFNELPRTHGKYIREEIKPHPLVGKIYRKVCIDDLNFNIELLPMVSPPIPWTSTKHGGYLLRRADFVRIFDSMPNAVQKADNSQLYPVFDSLNQLSTIPWRINTLVNEICMHPYEKILDLMIKIFVDGGSTKLKIPMPASSFDVKSLLSQGEKRENKKLTYSQQLYVTRKKGEMHGLWSEALYRLSLANHYRDHVIWLPHNIDFRGRVYPVPPHLTHIGNDLARALLTFAVGEKLGPNGLDWLKIHCINLTSLKKRNSTEDRLQYANEILPSILDSAENPLTGKMWWTESEDPWQTLACCIEIKNAIDSGDPENHVSSFPVHQDGSCNGLQHYAALGRDVAGGRSVNLLPSSVPQDVYSTVVALVEQERIKDAINGSDIARDLEGFVGRKIIKQTIMTTVYGVTRYGARLQIAKQLKDLEDFPPHLVWNGSMYLVTKTFHCLREMFTSAKEIQDWFTDCAKTICSESNECVQWETPLGLPVIQPYMKTKILSQLDGGKSLYNSKPNSVKQKNAFPPNFVHSLDSSHMMLTSIMCERHGITFVSVHDCFWTHPSTIDIMGKVCREQFVALHSEPILENLSEFFIRKYAGSLRYNNDIKVEETPFGIFKKVPERGDMDLTDVLRSEFFFS